MAAKLFKAVSSSGWIGTGDGEDITSFAREKMLNWMRKKAKTQLPEAALIGEAFGVEGREGTVEAASAGGVWSARLRQRCRQERGRVWIVECAVSCVDDDTRFDFRLSYSGQRWVSKARNIPFIVRDLSEKFGIFKGDIEMMPEAKLVATEVDFDDMARHLESPNGKGRRSCSVRGTTRAASVCGSTRTSSRPASCR